MHWVILIPYYFFCALAVLPLLMIVSRLLRLTVAINTLVGAAIVLSLAGVIVPLALDWVDLSALTGRPMLLLGLLSFVFAAGDAALARRLPLPLDQELRNL
jgi:hypothetical protein